MDPREKRIIKLRMLTPVFIGNGEGLKPLSYLLDGNTVHVIDEDKFFAQLSPEEQRRYQEWIESLLYPLAQIDDQIDQARDDLDRRRQLLRKRREIESNLSLRYFLANVLKTRPLPFVNKCEAYAARCATPPDRDGFRLCMKGSAYRPFIPGTEIKGALRTALLYALVTDPKNYPWLGDKLSQIRFLLRSDASPKEKINKFSKISNDLEAKMLRGEKEGEINNDSKFDVFRMIHVSDSTFLTPASLRVELTQMSGTKRYTKTWVETISSGSEVSVEIDFYNSFILWEKLGLKRLREWLSFPKLLEACFIRSKDLLDVEDSYFGNEPRLKSLITQLKRENKPDTPLLRLGQGQGFLGITVDLSVKKRDEKLYDEAIREGVTFQRRWKTQAGKFPKTRRLITDQGGSATSFLGWCKIIV